MKEKEKAICPQCGTEFTKGRYWQKYCTVECTKQYHNEKTKKEGNCSLNSKRFRKRIRSEVSNSSLR
jgi:hypothetical protein